MVDFFYLYFASAMFNVSSNKKSSKGEKALCIVIIPLSVPSFVPRNYVMIPTRTKIV
jgi:hypothetical protein